LIGPAADGPTSRGLASERPPARRVRGAWLAVGFLALVVFDLTANPVLGVAVGCLKFGWDELATARWLWARDPIRARGRVVALHQAAWALGRVTLVAIALMLFVSWASQPILALMRMRGRNVPNVADEFVAAGLVALGFSLATATVATIAVAAAWWSRVRVWVGPEAKVARKLDRWPPSSIPVFPVYNRARGVALVSAALVVFPVLLAITLIFAVLGHLAIVALGPPAGLAITAGGGAGGVAPALLVL
jgi:hypothetical protein